jgi:3-phenylpropionate/cinnamic acid dioxygenase small subunit
MSLFSPNFQQMPGWVEHQHFIRRKQRWTSVCLDPLRFALLRRIRDSVRTGVADSNDLRINRASELSRRDVRGASDASSTVIML